MKFLLFISILKGLFTINWGGTIINEEFLIGISLICFLFIVTMSSREAMSFFLFSDITCIYLCFYLISAGIYNLYTSYFSFFNSFYFNFSYLVISNVIMRFFNFTPNYNFIYFGINSLNSFFFTIISTWKIYLTGVYLSVNLNKVNKFN